MYYLLYDIILGINKSIFELSRKSIDKDLSEKEIGRVFNNSLTAKKIYTIVKSSAMNISLQLVDTSTDNKYHKLTSVLELQERGQNVTKSKNSVFPASSRFITGSDLYMGSILYLTKKSPTPKLHINPYVTLDVVTGRFTPTEEMKTTIKALDDRLVKSIGTNAKVNDSLESDSASMPDDVVDDVEILDEEVIVDSSLE